MIAAAPALRLGYPTVRHSRARAHMEMNAREAPRVKRFRTAAAIAAAGVSVYSITLSTKPLSLKNGEREGVGVIKHMQMRVTSSPQPTDKSSHGEVLSRKQQR